MDTHDIRDGGDVGHVSCWVVRVDVSSTRRRPLGRSC
jgi:hypothetical protein